MTEEQFNEITKFIYELIYSGCGKFIESETRQYIKNCFKSSGYIIKSELQTLVEEAEEMYGSWNKDFKTRYDANDLAEKQHEAIQALKKSHPEFKK